MLEQLDIPARSKEFLLSEGLPEYVDNPYLEFGIYDSDSAFVIGQHLGNPIIIQEPEGTVIVEDENGISLHMNRSVEHLEGFISIFQSSNPIAKAREEMMRLAPESLATLDSCFWAQVLEYEEALEIMSGTNAEQ